MAVIGILERFRRWRESLPGNGYAALTEMPPGSRPPRDTCLPIQPALRAIEYLQAEREKAIYERNEAQALVESQEQCLTGLREIVETLRQERDEARARAREMLNADPHCDSAGWVRRCPWLREERNDG